MIEAAVAMDWVPAGSTADFTRAVLEQVLPRCYWMNINEVYGGIGQILRKRRNRERVLKVLHELSGKVSIGQAIKEWMETIQSRRQVLRETTKEHKKRSKDTVSKKRGTQGQVHGTQQTKQQRHL